MKNENMNLELESIDCPICGSDQRKHLYKKPDTRHFLSAVEFNVVRCKRCTVGYVNPRPTIKNIQQFYPQKYYEGNARDMDSDFNRKRYPIQASYLRNLQKGARVLDVGCATGSFPRYLHEVEGFDAYGMDLIQPRVLDYDPSKLKFGILSELDYPDDYFDAITAWAVFQQLHNPIAYLKAINRMLKPGGRLVFLATNLNSLYSRFAYSEDIPRHLVFFTRKSLELSADKCDLRLEDIIYSNDIYSGKGYNVFQIRFLHDVCGIDWKKIRELKNATSCNPLMHLINIVSKSLLVFGRVTIPPFLERMMRANGIIIVIMSKARSR